jgi:transcriptional regulator with XRE-family HTH domain
MTAHGCRRGIAVRWNDALRHLRRAAGLTQAELAKRIGLSEPALSLYERGRRIPARETVVRLAEELNLGRRATNDLLDALGFEPLPLGAVAEMEARRPPLDALQRAIAAYPWPCLINNEPMELVCWNEAAVRVAELDFATAFPQPYQRHLMRISAHPNFCDADPSRRRVVNWDEIVAVLISLMKAAGRDISELAAETPYYQKLIQDVARDHPQAFNEIFRLWMLTPPLREMVRVTFPATWRLHDGTLLRFHTVVSVWSEFDGAWAIDWFPADGATWAWLARTAPPPGAAKPGAEDAVHRPWWRLLRDAREATGLSRRNVAGLAHVSVAVIAKYETGESRRPDRALILTLTRALDLDGTLTNAFLLGAGLPPEPSDLARSLAGLPVRCTFNLRWQESIAARVRITRIQSAVAAHPWPVVLINLQGVIIYCNPAMQRVIGHDDPRAVHRLRRQHVLRFVTSPLMEKHLDNWEEVAPALAPPPFRSATRPDSSYHAELATLLAQNPAMYERLQAVWSEAALPVLANRAVAPLRWRLESDEELRFWCVVARWEQNHPYWAIEWHPADGATWAWLSAPG